MSSDEKTTMKAEVEWVKGYLFLGNDKKGHITVFDSPQGGEAGEGTSPMEALLISVGACSGMDVVAILGKRNQNLTSLRVELVGERNAFGLPKPFTGISLRYIVKGKNLDRGVVEEAVKGSMEKYCSVAATVRGVAKIDYALDVIEG